MRLSITCIYLFILSSAFSQQEPKPYLRNLDGSITYYPDLYIEGGRFYPSEDRDRHQKIEWTELKAGLANHEMKGFNKSFHGEFIQSYFIRLGTYEKDEEGGLLTGQIHENDGIFSRCEVIFAQGENILVYTMMRTDHESTSVIPLLALIKGNIWYKIDNYFDKDRRLKGYELIKATFDVPEIDEWIDDIMLNKGKNRMILEELVHEIYFKSYYQEL